MGPDRFSGDEAVEASLSARYFPVALDLRGRRCLVVGGGPVAARKVHSLLAAGAAVTVVAPEISNDLSALARGLGPTTRSLSNVEEDNDSAPSPQPSPPVVERGDGGSLVVERRPFRTGDLIDVFLVVTATDHPDVNRRVADAARSRRILVNAADDPANCDFILPAVVRRGDVQIAITTGGQSPALARHLRERLEREVPAEYAPLAGALAAVRDELRQAGVRAPADAWQAAITDDVLSALRAGDTASALAQLRASLAARPGKVVPRGGPVGGDGARGGDGRPAQSTPPDQRPGPPTAPAPIAMGEGRDEGAPASPRGRIILVGAGPGDPDLLTVGGQRAISEADVIVYDRLVNPALLGAARPDARVVFAGKHRGGGPMSQEEINALICVEAQRGNIVVRLKGGDPFVFGRGGEEALAAVAAGVPFTVIPGITAAVAVPAYAGIPVTHRGLASSFTVLTGHEDPTKPSTSVDWDLLARFGGTLVLLMGVDTLPAICERLLSAGLAPDTPAAVVQDGTQASQRTVVGTIADIAERARAAGVTAPATTIIGQVVSLSDVLAWWQAACSDAAEQSGPPREPTPEERADG